VARLVATVGDDDHELLREVARQAGVAMRTLRLTRALQDSVATLGRCTAELEESRSRLFRVQAAARRRLERDLHDGVQQDVVALIARVGLARRQLERDPAVAPGVLAGVQDELGRVLGLLRELAHGIHPTVLTDRGLFEALEAQAARSRLPVTVHADPAVRAERYREEVEGAAYFTVSEALANVLKHARARSADVRLARRNGSLQLSVRDDGCGFDPAAVQGEGLRNLAERLTSVGGRLAVDGSPGRGTTVTAEIATDGGGDG
jgi:signal transduction histidine kinase